MLLEDDVNSQIPASVRHYCYIKARPTWFLLLELGGSKFLHSKKKKICKFNHESCMSVKFSETRVEKWIPKTTSIAAKCS